MIIQNRLGLLEGVETLMAQENRLNLVSNNLANADTTGFKKENVTFWEMLYKASDKRDRVGKAARVITNHQAGSAEQTGNPFDLAINGKGFFRIQTPQGLRYSRAGNFLRNAQGQITTGNGDLLLGQGGAITVQGSKVSIGSDGTILVDGQIIDQVAIADFDSMADLEKEGSNLFRLKEGATKEKAAENFELRQGYLETSNVNSVEEMTEMIDLYRAYEAQQKIVRTVDELDDLAVNRVGKLTA